MQECFKTVCHEVTAICNQKSKETIALCKISNNNNNNNINIKKICKQSSNKLYALARISPYLDVPKRKILMKSFITSQFNYCPIVWMYCQRKSNHLINRIHYNDYSSDFNLLLDKDNSVTIHHRNIQALTLKIYKSVHNLNPPFMKEIFCSKQQNYSLRNQSLVYPNPRTVLHGLETFGYRGSQIWYNLPREIQECADIITFENYISKNCIDISRCNLCKTYIANMGYIETIN